VDNTEHHIEFFTSSQFEQPKELTEFLQKTLTKNPCNKYCIDCKKNKTTHCILWIGSLVCEGCSIGHTQFPNATMSKCYVKEVYKEHWDDYQLSSIQIGGNSKLFEIMKEYDLLELEFDKKYKHPALVWYQKHHRAAMDNAL